MKTATVTELKKELKLRSDEDLLELCLRLSKFKKENKELLTYLLFESDNEEGFIQGVKDEVIDMFEVINRDSFFYIKKSVRKILRTLKKYIRYSQNKETEVELLLFFCQQLQDFTPSIERNVTLMNLYDRQIEYLRKKIDVLHEDLQHDYLIELEELEEQL